MFSDDWPSHFSSESGLGVLYRRQYRGRWGLRLLVNRTDGPRSITTLGTAAVVGCPGRWGQQAAVHPCVTHRQGSDCLR